MKNEQQKLSNLTESHNDITVLRNYSMGLWMAKKDDRVGYGKTREEAILELELKLVAHHD